MAGPIKPTDALNPLDRALLDDVAKRHPKSAITVRRGALDGAEGKPFGLVPTNWDGTHVVYEFRMVYRGS